MPPVSSLARLQRAVVLCIAIMALAWLAGMWSHSPAWAIAGAVAIACSHAGLLATQFVLMRHNSRSDPTPQASARQLLRAWMTEAVQAARVFGWRQPFAWRRIADRLEPNAAGCCGIVFIHGFVCNRGFWTPWMREAQERRIPFIAVNLEPVFASIDGYAATVESAVAKLEQVTGRTPVLVCHSMGGLTARAWLRAYCSTHRTVHVVTIGTPHGGTWLARFSHLANGRQMRPGGEWLQALPATNPAREFFTCWYTNCDNIVFPPSVATLPGADNRLLPGAAHVELAFRKPVIDDTFALVQSL